jgi:hypothetical protein
MSTARSRSASGPTAHALAPSAADLPLLRRWLQQRGTAAPVLTAPPMSPPGAAHGHALLWSWTAEGIAALGRYANACDDLDVALLVGTARWVPLDTVLGVLASAGLTPRAAAPIALEHHRGLELRFTRDEVPATAAALALLELVTWSAPWHRGRQQPLRMAVEGATPHDLRDHPHVSDVRDVWLLSPAALRLASPEIVLVGEADDATPDQAVREVLTAGGIPVVDGLERGRGDPLRRPTLSAEVLLLAPHGYRTEESTGSGDAAAATTTALQQLAAGTPVELLDTIRRELAPEVVDALDDPDLGAANALRQLRARTRLRWSVLRHHSAVSLAAALEARTGRELVPRPRLSLCLDATAPRPATGLDAAFRQLEAQRRRPDEVTLLTADGTGAVEDLGARLRHVLGIEVVVGAATASAGATGDLVVVAPLNALLATDALADLELAYQLWSPTVSVIPAAFLVDDDGRVHRRPAPDAGAQPPEGQSEGLAVPATVGVVAFAGRELRAHRRAEELTLLRRDGLVADAVRRGAMIYTMPSVRAILPGTPATLAGSRHLDVGTETLLVGDHAGR